MTRIALAPIALLLAHCAPMPDAMPVLDTATTITDGDTPRLVPLREVYAALPAGQSRAQPAPLTSAPAHHWPQPSREAAQSAAAAPESLPPQESAIAARVDEGQAVTTSLNTAASSLRRRAQALQAPVHDTETRAKLREALKNNATKTP